MRKFDMLLLASRNLRRHWVRTVLNIVGVGVGALAVSLVLSLSSGLRSFISYQVSALSDKNVIQVFPVKESPLTYVTSTILGRLGKAPKRIESEGGMNPGAFNLRYFKPSEVEALRSIPHIVRVLPGLVVFVDWIALEGSDERFEVVCIPEGEGFRMEVAAGRGFTEGCDDEVVLAWKYLEAFGMGSPEELLGRRVVFQVSQFPLTAKNRVSKFFDRLLGRGRRSIRISATVVGLAKPSLLSMAAFVPHELGKKIARFFMNDPQLHTEERFGLVANVTVDDVENIPKVREEIKKMEMSCVTVEDRLGFLLGMFFIIEIGLGVFAGIALIVAGLGIANTLVSSVFERRQEIGIMKALGCRSGTVTALFCLEAVLLGLVGGVAGCVVAFFLASIADTVINLTFAEGWGGVKFFLFEWWLPLLTLLFCGLSALVAGYYPARRAGRLDPISSLREE